MVSIQNPKLNCARELSRQILHREEGGPIKRRVTQIPGSDPQCVAAEHIPARRRLLLNEVCFDQGGAEPMRRSFRDFKPGGEFAEGKLKRFVRQEFQNFKTAECGTHGG